MRRLTRDQWFALGTKLYGPDLRKWLFECPSCGHVQSAELALQRNPSLDIDRMRSWIYYACEGRHTKGQGCDWTLGGLLRIHSLEVMQDGSPTMVFQFPDDPDKTVYDFAQKPRENQEAANV
jgi:phage terminase large subunit GpA-like protein